MYALSLQQLVFRYQFPVSLFQLYFNVLDRQIQLGRSSNKMSGRIHGNDVPFLQDFPGERIELRDAVDFVTEHLDADTDFLVRRNDVQAVASHPERAPGKVVVVSGVMHVDQFT